MSDEPTFELRAGDPIAPALVREWAMRRAADIESGLVPKDQEAAVAEAFARAKAMEAWYAEHAPPPAAPAPEAAQEEILAAFGDDPVASKLKGNADVE